MRIGLVASGPTGQTDRPELKSAVAALKALDDYLNADLDDELDGLSHRLRDAIEGKTEDIVEAMRATLRAVDEYRDYRSNKKLDEVSALLTAELLRRASAP